MSFGPKPWQQAHWDARAAGNFIGGGAGSGLIVAAAVAGAEGSLRALDFVFAAIIVPAPAALIVKQPDLGTALLVLAAGFFVIFFAGLPWTGVAVIPVAGIPSPPPACRRGSSSGTRARSSPRSPPT